MVIARLKVSIEELKEVVASYEASEICIKEKLTKATSKGLPVGTVVDEEAFKSTGLRKAVAAKNSIIEFSPQPSCRTLQLNIRSLVQRFGL